jgi:abequosyltransferase
MLGRRTVEEPSSHVSDQAAGREQTRLRLSVCIATFRRVEYIGETLRSILGQAQQGVEVVVVDGASPDGTAAVVEGLAAVHSRLRYHREPVNSGVDADYDKAVGYARGDYCWLLSDDDVLAPGAIERVLGAIADGPDLVVVNAESRTPDLSRVLDRRFLQITDDRIYGPGDASALFVDTAKYLSFIGAVVIRRSVWLARDRRTYDGSLFAHVGVIFQPPPLGRVLVVGEPLVRIRWGNAMWTPRGFEIWMFKWPALVWSFGHFSVEARAAVSPREPWRILRWLGLFRAQGGYSIAEYRRFLAGRGTWTYRLAARLLAVLPVKAANLLVTVYCVLVARWARRELYDMAYGPHSTWWARQAARLLGV